MKIVTPNKEEIYDVERIRCEKNLIICGGNYRMFEYQDMYMAYGKKMDYEKLKSYMPTASKYDIVIYFGYEFARKVMEMVIDYFTTNPNGVFILPTQEEIEAIMLKERK